MFVVELFLNYLLIGVVVNFLEIVLYRFLIPEFFESVITDFSDAGLFRGVFMVIGTAFMWPVFVLEDWTELAKILMDKFRKKKKQP